MKPILLEMTAFGSYAEKTVVPFDRLTHGLYLVTGDTGAGKTTIFDAIMFALYGTASGPDRTPEMMHCDFVDKSVDTEVRLKFRQGGKEYAVTRTIHYRKKRGTADRFGDGVLDAVLHEPDRDPIDGARKVTDRCTELLGLNAEQFRKIIMLAQGEFKEFLDADGDKKSEILGKLFDNSAYVRYQELLKRARDSLGEERIGYRKCIADTMQNVFLPPEDTEDGEQYLAEHPELARNLDALIGTDEQRLEEMKKERESYSQRKDVLTEQKGAADGRNQQLDALGEKKKHLAELEGQAEDMTQLRKAYDAAEKALHQVQPKRQLLENAEKRLRDTQKDRTGLQELLEIQRKVVEEAQAGVDGDDAAKQEVRDLELEIQKIEDTLPKYEELKQKRQERQAAEDESRKIDEKKNAAQTKYNQENEALEKLEEEQAALAGVDARLVELKNAYEKAKAELASLTGETGLKARVDGVAQKEDELAGQQEKLKKLKADAAAAEEKHHKLYQAFIGGQAGLIAEELRQSLAEYGSAVCPVCHSKFQAGHDGDFAVLPDETPTQTKVDAARRDWKKKEKARAEQDKNAAEARTAIDAEKSSILRDAQALLADCEDWDTLIAEGYLSRQIAQFRQAETEKKNASDEAAQKHRRSEELRQQHGKAEKKLEELKNTISQLDNDLNEHKQLAGKLDVTVSELQKHLQYPDKDTAEKQMQSQKKRRDSLNEQIADHQKNLEREKQTWDTTIGNLESIKKRLPGLEQDQSDADLELRMALEQSGFLSLEDVDRALLTLGGTDGESWLKEKQGALAAYHNDLENTRNRVKELEEQTKDFSYTDVVALQAQISQTEDQYENANNACGKLEKLLENHRNVSKRVTRAKSALARSEGTWKRLDLLANLAVGISGDGGKLSFDRYVMGAVFREILEMANRRLNVMSGGKYELIHQLSTDRKNAKAGLEVEVLDMTTGKQRNSKTLSGGESFLVSLSLALGLSDVVQNHAGGRKLDALFIDEGFGSLDNSTLDMALDVLDQLTEGNCLVGIISHVSKLEESIPQKIRVRNSEQGSSLQFE